VGKEKNNGLMAKHIGSHLIENFLLNGNLEHGFISDALCLYLFVGSLPLEALCSYCIRSFLDVTGCVLTTEKIVNISLQALVGQTIFIVTLLYVYLACIRVFAVGFFFFFLGLI
jgi:hypothetical protein